MPENNYSIEDSGNGRRQTMLKILLSVISFPGVASAASAASDESGLYLLVLHVDDVH